MQTDPVRRRSGMFRGLPRLNTLNRSDAIAALGAVGLLTLVVVVARPHLGSEMPSSGAQNTIDRILAAEDVALDLMQRRLAEFPNFDVAHPPVGPQLAGQGILALAIARQLPADDPAKIEMAQLARALAEARLARAPLDSHAWVRFAMAETILSGPTALGLEAFQRSMETGPSEYAAVRMRLSLGAVLWPYLDEPTRQTAIEQSSRLWRIARERRRLARTTLALPDEMRTRLIAAVAAQPSGERFEGVFLPAARQNRGE